MKKTNKVIITSVIVAVLLLGIGYAAIQNITLNINGTAAADPSQANFKVMFSGTPTVSDDTYVTAAITDDTNATVNVEGLTKKGDVVTATYTVQNASEDLSADLAVSTTNNNTEFFTLSSEIAQTSLVAGEATTLTVTVELTKTPIKESVSTTIGVQLEAMPVQPGEEGTSEGINGSSQTPSGINEYGFYFDKFYANQDEGMGIIAHEDGTVEMFAYILSGEIEGLDTDEWMCMDYLSAGEVDFNEMIANGVTISQDGKIINMDGVDLEILDVDLHGVYYGGDYSIETDDNREIILMIKEDGTIQLTTYENGEIVEDIVEEIFLNPIANGYQMTYDNQITLISNVSGERIYFEMVGGTFTLKEKHNYVSEVTKKVTCNENGERKNTCLDCNKTYTVTVLTTNHSNDADNDGVCDDCGETITYTDFEVSSSNRYKIGYSNSTTDLVIPENFYDEGSRTWYRITSIGSSAFYEDTNLTSVVIPEGVTSIGDSAFTNCSALTEINVDSNNLKYSSIDGILCNKDASILIKYPEGKVPNDILIPEGITTIGKYAFYNCINLTNIVIPEGVTTIEENAFDSCDGLISVVIAEGVTTIEGGTFIHCINLTNVSLPIGLTTIENWAFQNCTNLTNIDIPEGVTTIGHSAFMACDNLTEINVNSNNSQFSSIDGIVYSKDLTKLIMYPVGKKQIFIIPKEVTTISYGAFYDCSNLSSIVIQKEVISIENSAFSGCYMLNTVNYTGTEEQWNAIQIGTGNKYLTNATINYNYVIPTE